MDILDTPANLHFGFLYDSLYTIGEIVGEVPYRMVGEDLEVYGPYRVGERVRLPYQLAELLAKRGLFYPLRRPEGGEENRGASG